MRSTAHLNGHPIHPILVGFPAAYLFGSAAIDVWARATDRPAWFRTARHLNAIGLGSAVIAALPGLIDYADAIPPRSSARTRATNHMFANLSALALFGLSRLGRRDADERPRAWAVAAQLCGAGLIALAGWIGGTLVYRNQIGVDHRYADAGKWRPASARLHGRRRVEIESDVADALDVDQMRLVRAGRERIALARTESGLRAFSDRCTHRGGPLSDGALACGLVQCPWHGSQFDVETGDVRHGPAEEPIKTFDVERVTHAPSATSRG